MKMKGKKIFWGIFFILVAVYVVVSKLGILPDIGTFKILLTAFLIALLVQGIRCVQFYEILFPLAGIGILYDEALGITELTPWTLLWAALFGSIGLSMLFRGKQKAHSVNWKVNCEGTGDSREQCCDEQIRCENNFGSAIRYINSDNFKNANLENNFGSMSIYFDNAIVQEGSAYINVENNFGETNLYIPKEWRVQNNLTRSFGGVKEKGKMEGTSNTILYINGETNFGGINIIYV